MLALPLLFPEATFSQTARPKNTYKVTVTDSSAKYPPQIYADRTVTLRVPAPAAAKVILQLQGGANAATSIAMEKDANGLWRITLGPLEPDLYMYWFEVDGMVALDMSNSRVSPGRQAQANLFEVPGTSPRFDEWQDVPHGALHVREYYSRVVSLRRICVYVPPPYDRDVSTKFPVLYLRHGNNGLEDRWYRSDAQVTFWIIFSRGAEPSRC